MTIGLGEKGHDIQSPRTGLFLIKSRLNAIYRPCTPPYAKLTLSQPLPSVHFSAVIISSTPALTQLKLISRQRPPVLPPPPSQISATAQRFFSSAIAL